MPLTARTPEAQARIAQATQTAASLAKAAFADALAFWSRFGIKPETPTFAAATGAGMQAGFRVGAELRTAGQAYPCVVTLPFAAITMLAKLLKLPRLSGVAGADGADGASASTDGADGASAPVQDPLLYFHAASDRFFTMIEKQYAAPWIAAPAQPEGAEPMGCAPIAGIFSLMDERDARVTIQNFFLPAYGLRKLPYLFYYHAIFERNGKTAYRPRTPYPFRDSDMLPLLSDILAEDWADCRSRDFFDETVPWPAFVAFNRKIGRELAEASLSGKIRLSEKTKSLLATAVLEPLRAGARKEVDNLNASGYPFAFLKGSRERNFAARLIDHIDNRDLALACIGLESSVPDLELGMSKGRRAAFEEDLSAAKQRWDSGELDPAEVVDRKRLVEKQLKERFAELKDDR